jgi:hypothetical protein
MFNKQHDLLFQLQANYEQLASVLSRYSRYECYTKRHWKNSNVLGYGKAGRLLSNFQLRLIMFFNFFDLLCIQIFYRLIGTRVSSHNTKSEHLEDITRSGTLTESGTRIYPASSLGLCSSELQQLPYPINSTRLSNAIRHNESEPVPAMLKVPYRVPGRKLHCGYRQPILGGRSYARLSVIDHTSFNTISHGQPHPGTLCK